MSTRKLLALLCCVTSSALAFAKWEAETKMTRVMRTPIERLTGYVHSNIPVPLSQFAAPEIPQDMPWQFDWRDLPGGLTPIKDQGGCGSCWAFGTTAALEQAIKIRSGQTVSLSEQELVSCSHSGSCSGGNFAHGYQATPGQSLSEEFPYRASNLRCKSGLSHQWKIKNWGYVGGQGRAPSVEEIKAAILQYGAVAVTVYADSRFQSYKSGIFDSCRDATTNHLVALVGWDDQQKIWFLRNSWRTGWGEQGYMRIKWGCSNVAEEATYVEVEAGE